MADKSRSGTLEDQEFVEFYKMLTERREVLDLFQDYSSDGQTLSQCDLEEFLREEQLEGESSYEHALQLIDRYEPSETGNSSPLTPTFSLCNVYIFVINKCPFIFHFTFRYNISIVVVCFVYFLYY